MLSVACLLAQPGEGAALAARLRPRAVVDVFEDRRALMTHVRTRPVAAVVVDLRDGAGRATSGTVRALRAAAPALPLLARCRLAEPDCRALLDFARAGGTDVLVEDAGLEPLLAVLRPGGAASPDALVRRLVAAGIPERFAPLLEHLVANVDAPDAARAAAAHLGVGRRALERRLARASLPSPRTLQSWCRLLVAADRLCGDAVVVERVALDVGFSSANALRNALQRHAGTTPSAVRAAGGLEALVARLCRHEPAQRRVAERAAGADGGCALFPALLARQRLVARLTQALVVAIAFARRDGCRGRCAAPLPMRRIVAPRSRRRTSAAMGGRAAGGTVLDRRATCYSDSGSVDSSRSSRWPR
ncbi:Helix-turn-helix, AraC domain-containing protein [Gemmatirosa kalamazoonensis]|uniref:Helix-turn-helix, AraC domain-containing protein n=1 Tax=Gemmatirosa kalamazoonensis TaxID=861299 RepID=W0RLS8_9BACT|nr:helix-turn-helix domain-containing protein [Gemmatirosa kalamazoonensis]AHG91412.1 Helix-turn-helix, AraC domain-containing protein [Gemmatirosa kalamazoonensis]